MATGSPNPISDCFLSKTSSPNVSGSSAISSQSSGLKRPMTNSNQRTVTTSNRQSADTSGAQKTLNKVPVCLKKLVRSIVRTFYSREHSLIVDMLVRNTIMKEDDLCERLRFEKKQLRQYLHILKTDQFIKSKLQLETDAEGKTTKITHYYIEYKLFVNVVKYRLDQMQRRLEAEQRQSTSRANFKCASCHMAYSDLEVDRLLDLTTPGKLICVYCRSEVTEEEDSVSRTDARALIAKFHQQIRDPIDAMLRECDAIHLSSSILEPEFRALEPLNEDSSVSTGAVSDAIDRDSGFQSSKQYSKQLGPTESKVRIILSGQSNEPVPTAKPCPVWMADSTINTGSISTFGELDRNTDSTSNSSHPSGTPSISTDSNNTNSLNGGANDLLTQTLTPGRVPNAFASASTNSGTSSKEGNIESTATGGIPTNSGSAAPSSGDIMQLLLVHERRGLASHTMTKASPTGGRMVSNKSQLNTDVTGSGRDQTGQEKEPQKQSQFVVHIGETSYPYGEITPDMIKRMTVQERSEYVRIGKQLYMGVMLD